MRKIHPRLIQAYQSTISFLKHRTTIKVIKWLSISILVMGFFAFGIVYGYVSSLVEEQPVISNEEIREAIADNDITSFAYFNDQTEVGRLSVGEDRMNIELDEIPQQVIDAVIAIEDKNFYTHHGIDIRGTLRAIKQQLGHENTQTGGSTITQQLSRRLFLSLDQTYERKATEILIAMRVDRVVSKDDILLAYLSKIYFGKGSDGNNLYGVKSAAKGIFDIDDLHKLNTAQAAYLVGLPQQPNAYSAFDRKGKVNTIALDRAIERQRLVLLRMKEEQKITEDQYKEALDFEIKASLSKSKAKTYNTYPFLMTEVERRSIEIILKLDHPNIAKSDPNYDTLWDEAKDKLIRKGYHIHTTIDPIIYHEMNLIAENKTYFTEKDPKKGLEQVGAIMIDNHSGAILAMMEGRDFQAEQLNHATQMVRQPGSAMKPIAAYLPALEEGLIQPGSIIDDVPIVLDSGNGAHIPENWDGQYHGLITAREALEWSYNIPALKLFNDKVGIKEAWSFARKLGITSITSQDEQAQTGVIGGLTYGVSVEELTNAYATIGNQGTYNQTYLIDHIEDAAGKIIFEHQDESTVVFSEQTAYLMTDMMHSVVKSGTAKDLARYYNHYDQAPFVGKTGSTQNNADAWFIGYTPDITVGVWAGYDQPIHKLSTHHCSKNAGCGISRAKKIWAHIMDASMEKRKKLFVAREFIEPENIVSKTVSKYSGMLPTQELRDRKDVIRDIFNKAYVPTEIDDVARMTPYVTYNGTHYVAHPETPSDMVSYAFMVSREKSIADIIQEVKAGLKRMPADDRKSISHYYPKDAELDGPSEVDPRTDDGSIPSAPVSLNMNKDEEKMTIVFPINQETDVVGYRLYGSNDGETFSILRGKPVSVQSDAHFTINQSQDAMDYYMYALTAVDVVGNESMMSDIVFNDHKSIEDWFSDFFKNNDKKNNKDNRKNSNK
jgi:penicillin-binding protein